MFRRRSLRKTFILGLIAVLCFCAVETAWGCPTCKDGLSESQTNMARGYFWSILFMMSAPFLILTGVGAYFYWEIRKARRRQAGAAGEHVFHGAAPMKSHVS